jgi:Holliday junction resolvase
MRAHPRLDANHNDIVSALRAAGATVQSLASVGGGCPDLLVGFRGTWFCIEIKDGKNPLSKQRLTNDEQEWHNTAQAPVHIVNSVDKALQILASL